MLDLKNKKELINDYIDWFCDGDSSSLYSVILSDESKNYGEDDDTVYGIMFAQTDIHHWSEKYLVRYSKFLDMLIPYREI